MGFPPFKPDRIKAVFFDINETLIDPESTFRQGFYSVWNDVSGRAESEGGVPTAGRVWEAFMECSVRGGPIHRSVSYAERERRNKAALAAAFAKLHVELPGSAVPAFLHRVGEQQEKHPVLYPGTAETLEALAKSYRVAVISNGKPDKQIRRLRAAGLFPPLREESLFFSSAVGVRKPHPVIFRHALEKLGVRPDQAVMVGNSWSKDIIGATLTHLHAIWFRPGRLQKHYRRKIGSARVHIVQSMEQLLPLFDAAPSGKG